MTISVITATHKNLPELIRATDSLNAQTYQEWQHIVIADGPDPEVQKEMGRRGYRAQGKRIFVQLGRNWHNFLGGDFAPNPPGAFGHRGGRGSRGVTCYKTGTYLASGDYISYLDSDVVFRPDHLEACAKRIKETDADFVFTRMMRFFGPQPRDVIGTGKVAWGHIDGNMVVHKAELLAQANWEWGGDADFTVIQKWAKLARKIEYIPEITVDWHHELSDIW